VKTVRLLYTPTARDYIRKINPSLKRPLREAIEELSIDPLKGKPLQEEFSGYRSHRFKKYRIVYRFQEVKNTVEIIFAGPRSDVYQLFSDYLEKLRHS
jgi:addiction module RelE/StbE family toxin